MGAYRFFWLYIAFCALQMRVTYSLFSGVCKQSW
jgi:hypothetical protein